MTFPIIVARNQNGWEERRGTCSSQPSASGVTALSISTRVACTATKSAGYRIRVGKRAGDRSGHLALRGGTATILENNLPAKFTQSARVSPACADTGGLRGILLPAFRPRAQFFPIVKAIGSLFLVGIHSAFAVRQNLPRWIANLLHVSTPSASSTGLVACSDAHRLSERKSAWAAENFSLRSMK